MTVEQSMQGGETRLTAEFEARRSREFRCASNTVGSCVFERCLAWETTSDGGVTAGTIRVENAQGSFEATPMPTGQYSQSSRDAGAWRAGESLSVRAAGAAAPMFDKSLTIPSTLTVTDPVLTVTPALNVVRANPLQIRWQPYAAQGDEKVRVILSAYDTAQSTSYVVTCSFDPASGMATVPASVFGANSDAGLVFPSSQGTLRIAASRTLRFTIDDWETTVNVDRLATTDAGVSIAQVLFR